MNITSPQEGQTMTRTFTITEDISAAASYPYTFEATLEEATARFNERFTALGQTEDRDWELTLWEDSEILGFAHSELLEQGAFTSQATLDARSA